MATTNKSILVILIFLLWTSSMVFGQELKVYSSPHSLDSTISKIKFSIAKNNYQVLDSMVYFEDRPNEKFQGKITVLSFSTEDVEKLALCEPTTMLDMPLKIIVWKEYGDTYMGYLSAKLLRRRFMATDCDEIIDLLDKAMIRIINDTIRKY